MSNIIEVKNLTKVYKDGSSKVKALDSISFNLLEKESLAIIGSSGSGKTTLLHILGGLENPTSGDVIVAGKKIDKLKEKEQTVYRNKTIGFVFQFFYLIDYLNALDNVAVPLILSGSSKKLARQKAMKLLEKVGLVERAYHFPNQLSGGEMQRVAVARSLANDPKLILADEPTGNLDKENAERVLKILEEIMASGVSVVVITHDKSVSDRFKNVLKLNKGKHS